MRIELACGVAALLLVACGSDSTNGADASGGGAGACGSPAGPFSLPLPPDAPTDYTTTTDTVTDGVTRLVWQRAVTSTQFDAADTGDPGDEITAGQAYCATLTLDGESGFVLPSRIELVTIQDQSVANPSIDVSAFPDTPADVFWSSSRAAVGPTVYFAVSFSDGTVTYDGDIQGDQRVRCVLPDTSVPDPATPYSTHGSTTWDARTGLVWERDPSTDTFMTTDEAAAHCKQLEVDGCGGFRLPTAKELDSIVDETRAGPAVDVDAFPDTDGWYWSSTEYPRTPGFWLAQSSGDGVMYPNVQPDGAHAPCVR
ncbi:MAG TPA: DUF1566 domain-containing protein [Byssovorax sp.]|jgi:hypothetical protein